MKPTSPIDWSKLTPHEVACALRNIPGAPVDSDELRLCVDTRTNRKRWLPSKTEVVEFLGNYRGPLDRAPGGILAFALPKRGRMFTASVEHETRSRK